MTRELTDTQRFWLELKQAGEQGLHSWDCYGWTRNAPQRAKDCVDKGQRVYVVQERRNGRPGARYYLDGFEPDYAVPVKGNGVEGGATKEPGTTPGADLNVGSAPLNIVPAPEQVGVKRPVALFRDYTDPNGTWVELPIDEHGWPIERAA